MGKKTPLYSTHQALGAKIVDFGGWDMPLHYGSQIQEHQSVRQDAGVFDVSHMTIVDVLGTGARDFLRYLLANDIDKLQGRHKALYSVMLNHDGGIIDDLIVYFIDVQQYRLVLNAANHDKNLAWLSNIANEFSVGLQERSDLAMLAVQGPNAITKMQGAFTPLQIDKTATLENFEFVEVDHLFIARTGYTGEAGYEIILPAKMATAFWQKIYDLEIAPCGLGARDTLRLEAGLNLSGQDMDESTNPYESNLGWTVACSPADRLFVGRAALELQQGRDKQKKLIGLVLEGKGIMRSHQKVKDLNGVEGIITSGSFSPTLGVSIAFARVPKEFAEKCEVEIRDQWVAARTVKLPFVRNGKILV